MNRDAELKLKFCKDCKWHKLNCSGHNWSEMCTHPALVSEPNLVNGIVYGANPYEARAGKCGKEGRFWEEHVYTSWWKRK